MRLDRHLYQPVEPTGLWREGEDGLAQYSGVFPDEPDDEDAGLRAGQQISTDGDGEPSLCWGGGKFNPRGLPEDLPVGFPPLRM